MEDEIIMARCEPSYEKLKSDLRKLVEEKISGINTATDFGKGYAAASYEWANEVKKLLED